jgi:hypothetical protein
MKVVNGSIVIAIDIYFLTATALFRSIDFEDGDGC